MSCVKAVIFISILFLPFYVCHLSQAETKFPLKYSLEQQLANCTLNSWGYKFLCSPNWPIKDVDDKTTILTLSQDPYVTMTLSRIETNFVFLEQLTRDYFVNKNLYLDNFVMDRVDFANIAAIHIKAFSRLEPDMRFSSYFFMTEESLQNILFSVYPSSEWDNYKFLIREIISNFTIIPKTNNTHILF